MNEVQGHQPGKAQPRKYKWLKGALPLALLLLVAAGATAYFPKSAKGGSTPSNNFVQQKFQLA